MWMFVVHVQYLYQYVKYLRQSIVYIIDVVIADDTDPARIPDSDVLDGLDGWWYLL